MFTIVATAKSKLKKEIELLEIKPSKYKQTILIIGMFHGDEPEGKYLIDRFIENFTKQPKNRILIIPCLNPDGKKLKTRQNSNKVDLNRNFPTKNWKLSDDPNYFGGNKPNSESETQFMVKILEKYNIDCILTLHSPYKIVNYDGPAKEIAEEISRITGYPTQKEIGYPTPGSFGTYAGIEKRIPTITLELPDNENYEMLWNQNKEIFEYFFYKF